MDRQWHTLSVGEVLKALNTRHSGLTDDEAKARLVEYGANELKRKKKTHGIVLFLRQFLSPLIYVLLAAVVVSAAIGRFIDAGVIAAVLLINAVIGFVQESRAERAMEALLKMTAPKAKVLHGGKLSLLPTREIVPGDIIVLEAGDRVPADARLVEVTNLKVDEAALTGESLAVEKHSDVLSGEVAVADRINLVYMGTIVTYGRAMAVVVTTGASTEMGKIATALEEVEREPTPIQKSIGKLSRFIIVLFLGFCSLLVVVGVVQGLGYLDVFMVAVAAAASAIPEGLPAVVTVVLAVGMRTMARHNAIIRRLVAVETLGAATVICSDKTGTLTLNEMTVRRLYMDGETIEVTGETQEQKGEFYRHGNLVEPQGDATLNMLLTIGALCNDSLLAWEDGRCCTKLPFRSSSLNS